MKTTVREAEELLKSDTSTGTDLQLARAVIQARDAMLSILSEESAMSAIAKVKEWLRDHNAMEEVR